MAHLVAKTDSPFLQLRTRGADGKWHQRSTVLRKDNRLDRRRAHALAEEESIKERTGRNVSGTEKFSAWVLPFLRSRHSAPHQARTLERYLGSWRVLSVFLERHGLHHPRQLRYANVLAYHAWRMQPDDDRVRSASHNTSLGDVKLLGIVLDEAVRREFCERNPCHKTGLTKQPSPQKPEISGPDIALILDELQQEPEWMFVSFQISIAHGTRLRATSIDLRRDVNWDQWTVTFHEKGQKVFTVPLQERLRPLFERLRAEGRERTCEIPEDASKHWRRFFDRIGRPQYCFHCCRVTVISRLARAGVNQSQAMKFVGHSSADVHTLYQRLQTEDLAPCAAAVKTLPAATPPVVFYDYEDECDGAERVRI
ncbi:MAG: hypothetical protein ABMA26_00510 [Limisphaerales bacterium]